MRKTIILLILTSLFGCTKTDYKIEQPKLLSRSAFPSYISLGNDTSYFRVDSVCLCNASAYLATCGTAPETEAPVMGTDVYQIEGATQGIITGSAPRVSISNLTFGTYKFVGHTYMLGFRTCDSTYQDVSLYDTITITILKNKKRIK